MAIKQVRAQVNGQWYTLTLQANGKYEASITAPGATSFNQPGGYYNVTVEATNTAGSTGTANAGTLDGLKLYVKEKVPPVITILSPSSGAYVNNNLQPVVFTITDEANGSGVNLSSVVVRLNGDPVPSGQISHSAITNGYSFTYTPSTALDEGQNTVTVDASDNDGNAATQKSTTFTVDTVPPTLNITSPQEGYITRVSSLVVSGTTNDATSSPVTVVIRLNGADQGAVSVGSGGAFSKTVTLVEGANTIIITAADASGKSTSVTRNVTLDTTVPKITSASISPNPVDAGQTVIVSVEVS